MIMDVPYTDQSLTFAGRWSELHESAGSAWQGSQIRFKVSGTKKLEVKVRVIDKPGAGGTFSAINVDGSDTKLETVSGDGEVFDGVRTVSFDLPSTAPHDIVLKLFALSEKQWSGDAFVGLQSVSTGRSGKISRSGSRSAQRIQFIGDSWMSVQNDWPYLLDNRRYDVDPVAFGGATIADLDEKYLYRSPGVLQGADRKACAVVIGSGVNDLYNNVSDESYRVSMLSLISKVKSQHPGVRVILLQAPDSLSYPYGKYGLVMSEIADADEDVSYISLPSQVNHEYWFSDGMHVNHSGRKQFASIVGPEIRKVIQSDPVAKRCR